MGKPELVTTPAPELFGLVAARMFAEAAQQAVAERGTFRVALAGGTSPEPMYRTLAEIPLRDEIDWSKIAVFFGDERCVPEGDLLRNDRTAWELLLQHVPIPTDSIHRVDPTAPNAADLYDYAIRKHFHDRGEAPRFDLIVLGMGMDGHTASLFPGNPALGERQRAVVKVTNAPKPPPDRITITLPLINAARFVLLLAPGEKRTVVADAMFGNTNLPIAWIAPPQGRAVFLVDPPEGPPVEEPKTAVEMA